MAGKSSKKQAQSNLVVLRNLYAGVTPLLLLASVRQWISGRGLIGWIVFILLHLPVLISVYALDSSGRPKYDSDKRLIREGMDLSQPGGLTEYMFDVIYLSLFGDLGQVLFNTKKFWYSLFLVPIYGIWKIYGMMPKSSSYRSKSSDAQSGQSTQSKRQAKLAKRKHAAQI